MAFFSSQEYTFHTVFNPLFSIRVCLSFSLSLVAPFRSALGLIAAERRVFLKWPLGEGPEGHSEPGWGEEEQLALLILWVNLV